MTVAHDAMAATIVTELIELGEDFGHFQARIPGVMYYLGVSNTATGTEGMPHTPGYVADEGSILVGARVMSALVLSELQ